MQSYLFLPIISSILHPNSIGYFSSTQWKLNILLFFFCKTYAIQMKEVPGWPFKSLFKCPQEDIVQECLMGTWQI